MCICICMYVCMCVCVCMCVYFRTLLCFSTSHKIINITKILAVHKTAEGPVVVMLISLNTDAGLQQQHCAHTVRLSHTKYTVF